MLKRIAVLTAVLALSGCGIPEYFNQHHANVREVSADDDSDNVTPSQHVPVAQPPPANVVQLQPPVVPAPVVTVVPAQPPATSRRVSPSPVGLPPNTYVAPPRSAVATSEAPIAVRPPPLPKVLQHQVAAPVAPAPAVAVVPPQPPATSRQGSSSSAGPPPNAHVVPTAAAVATTEEILSAVPRPPIVNRAPAQPSPPPQVEAAPAITPMDVPAATTPAPNAAPVTPREVPPEQPSASAAQEFPLTPASSAPPTIHDYCESLAAQRAADAAANGYDDDTQHAVHDGSYKKCVIWETAHRRPE